MFGKSELSKQLNELDPSGNALSHLNSGSMSLGIAQGLIEPQAHRLLSSSQLAFEESSQAKPFSESPKQTQAPVGSEQINQLIKNSVQKIYAQHGANSNSSQQQTLHNTEAKQPLVGIIDTGFSQDDPNLHHTKVTLGRDRVDGDNNPLLIKGAGNEHGTQILDTIAAKDGNASLWLGRAVGSGKWSESLVEFVDSTKASGKKNAIVNLSFDLTQVNPDGSTTTRTQLTAEERVALKYAHDNGIIIVAAAGNTGGQMSALGQASQEFDNIITVGAAKGLSRADYSSYGKGLTLLADGTAENGGARSEGTSTAAAKVSADVAKVWETNSNLNYRQVISALKSTAADLKSPGWDAETGTGLVNIEAALSKAKASIPADLEALGGDETSEGNLISGTTLQIKDAAFISERPTSFWSKLKKFAEVVTQPIVQAVETVAEPIVQAVEVVTQPIVQAVETVAEPIVQAVETVAEPIASHIWNATKDLGEGAWDVTKDLSRGHIADAAKDAGKTAVNVAKDEVNTSINLSKDVAHTSGEVLTDHIRTAEKVSGTALHTAEKVVEDHARTYKHVVQDAGEAAGKILEPITPNFVKSAVRWTGEKVVKPLEHGVEKGWEGAKWVTDQSKDKAFGIPYRGAHWVEQLPDRVERLGKHVVSGEKIGDWVKHVSIDIGDLSGLGEAYETWIDLKPNARKLTDHEVEIAKSVFGDSINYDLVRIDNGAFIGPSSSHRPYTSFHTINTWGSLDDATLIHELTHVWQYEHDGSIYMPDALLAQKGKGLTPDFNTDGYDYGGAAMLKSHIDDGLGWFNYEAQAHIIEDYYKLKYEAKTLVDTPIDTNGDGKVDSKDSGSGDGVKELWATDKNRKRYQVATETDLPTYAHFVDQVSTKSEDQLK